MGEELSERFARGLRNYNLSPQEIQDGNWSYCGGRKEGSCLKYFRLKFPNRELPAHNSNCVCGHTIKDNRYITDGERILILGSCCIKRFMPLGTARTCEVCNNRHRNRIVNRCNHCRINVCDKCGEWCNERYKICYDCYTR